MKHQTQGLPRKAALSASVLALALVSTLAQASPITQWSFETDSNFIAPTTFETGGAGTTTQAASGDELSWGATGGNFQIDTGNINTNRSALTVGTGATGDDRLGGGPASGTINTTIGGSPNILLGQIGLGTSFTHWNNPISSAFNTLLGGTIEDTLTLTPIAGPEYFGGPLVNAPTLTFQFKFQETPNAGTGGVCANGLPVPTGGCPDLFGFNQTTLNNPFEYIDYGADDAVGGGDDFLRTYFASVFVLDASGAAFPLAQLTVGECTALALNNDCFGFRTAEAGQTTAQFGFAVTTEPIVIPEPGSIALLGLALAGLGMTRRRAIRKSA